MKKGMIVLIITLFACAVLLAQETTDTKEASFIGIKKCKKCHLKQFKSWKKTKMANAFDLLKPGIRAEAKKQVGLDPQKDYTADENCVGCHTIGYKKPGGFVDLATTPKLIGVGCEMCHGAGSHYTQSHLMSNKNKNFKLTEVIAAGLNSPIDENTCVDQCHNEKSPFYDKANPFTFKTRKEKGTHKHFPLKHKHD